MAGRLTWRVRAWRSGALVEPLPQVRAAWGDAIGELAEMYAAMARTEEPGHADVRRTLQAIARAPDAVPWHSLDAHTDSRLDAMAWRLHRVMFARHLAPQQLQACAIAAAGETRGRAGRKRTQGLAALFLCDLQPLLPARCRRGEAYKDAVAELLIAAGLVQPRNPDADAMDSVRLLRARAKRLRG